MIRGWAATDDSRAARTSSQARRCSSWWHASAAGVEQQRVAKQQEGACHSGRAAQNELRNQLIISPLWYSAK